MLKNRSIRIFLAVIGVLILAIGLYYTPPVYSRLSWRLDDIKSRIKSAIYPPDQAVFVPTAQAASPVVTLPPPSTRVSTQTPEPVGPTPAPTPTSTPLPERVDLNGIKYYVDQCNRWNYCGPSNLAMSLNFWGWKGTRDEIAKVIKPGSSDPKLDFIQRGRTDLNVMPYELVGFVNDETEYRALTRYGGTLELIKTLLAGGFPVIIEKGYYQRDVKGAITWMGHYAYVTGYDEAKKIFIWQDVYVPIEQCIGKTSKIGGDKQMSYDDFLSAWRGFNFLFIVDYPVEKEAELTQLLGNWNDAAWANRHALEMAQNDAKSLTGLDLYYAWFNQGTSHVQLLEYTDAASAYDQAFAVYPSIPKDKRPWRMLWYQTSPYWAYFYTGRYTDVVNLANLTLSTPSTGPTLEESLYWRGMAELALGDSASAIADFRASVYYNPGFVPGLSQLETLGVKP